MNPLRKYVWWILGLILVILINQAYQHEYKKTDRRPPTTTKELIKIFKKPPRDFAMTHSLINGKWENRKEVKIQQVIAKKGGWTKIVQTERQTWMWVESLGQMNDPRVYVKCSPPGSDEKRTKEKFDKAKSWPVMMNKQGEYGFKQAFPKETRCRCYGIKIPEDSTVESAVFQFLSVHIQ